MNRFRSWMVGAACIGLAGAPAAAQAEKPAKAEPETARQEKRAVDPLVAALADYGRALLLVERLQNELKAATDVATALRKLDELSKALSDVRAALWKCRDAGGWKTLGSRAWKEEPSESAKVVEVGPGLTALVRPAPEAFARQPELKGVIEHTEKGLCVVRIKENPDDIVVKPGWFFAVHDGKTYKGEAVITDVTGKFAFCRITKSVPGTTIAAGDKAETNVGL